MKKAGALIKTSFEHQLLSHGLPLDLMSMQLTKNEEPQEEEGLLRYHQSLVVVVIRVRVGVGGVLRTRAKKRTLCYYYKVCHPGKPSGMPGRRVTDADPLHLRGEDSRHLSFSTYHKTDVYNTASRPWHVESELVSQDPSWLGTMAQVKKGVLFHPNESAAMNGKSVEVTAGWRCSSQVQSLCQIKDPLFPLLN